MMTDYITYIIFQEKKTLCINSFCKFIRFRLSFCSIPAMTMWARWEERFKMFGANRVNFTTSACGGNKDSNNTITNAKCLLFFDDQSQDQLSTIIDQTLCSEKLEVAILRDEDFKYSARDGESGFFYGSRKNYFVLEFNPVGLPESRGQANFSLIGVKSV